MPPRSTAGSGPPPPASAADEMLPAEPPRPLAVPVSALPHPTATGGSIPAGLRMLSEAGEWKDAFRACGRWPIGPRRAPRRGALRGTAPEVLTVCVCACARTWCVSTVCVSVFALQLRACRAQTIAPAIPGKHRPHGGRACLEQSRPGFPSTQHLAAPAGSPPRQFPPGRSLQAPCGTPTSGWPLLPSGLRAFRQGSRWRIRLCLRLCRAPWAPLELPARSLPRPRLQLAQILKSSPYIDVYMVYVLGH